MAASGTPTSGQLQTQTIVHPEIILAKHTEPSSSNIFVGERILHIAPGGRITQLQIRRSEIVLASGDFARQGRVLPVESFQAIKLRGVPISEELKKVHVRPGDEGVPAVNFGESSLVLFQHVWKESGS